MMSAVAPLMLEHRLINRMMTLIKAQAAKMERQGRLDLVFIDSAVDFIRNYAELCHHGKEEKILFESLKHKPLTEPQRKTLLDLMAEHNYGRRVARELAGARENYARGDITWALPEALKLMKGVAEFYPKHIALEDKDFFIPCMQYYTEEEQQEMLRQFDEYDKQVLQNKYKEVVEIIEQRG